MYISKSGIDVENCGLFHFPCGTMNYASILALANTISTIYVIDGQNKTEIQSYIDSIVNINNNTNNSYINSYYHPCLPESIWSSQYKFTIIFDDILIKSMTDWYPPICDDESIINSILNNHTSFFEVQDPNHHAPTAQTATTSFINLIINNYHFSYFTLLNSVTELNSATDLYAHHLAVECQNCQFTNISFTCEENPNISPYLIVAYALYFSNVTISDVVISCESSSMFAQEYYMIGSEIVLDDVLISNIWIQHSIFKTI
eukprot:419329_1